MKLRLRDRLVAWHATDGANLAPILRDGLRRSIKGVYLGLQPGIAAGFGRSYGTDPVLLTLAVPWRMVPWGGDLLLDAHEGCYWGDLPPAAVLDHRPLETCGNVASTWLHSDVDPGGYAPWFIDRELADEVAEVMRAGDSQETVVAALYAEGLPAELHGRLEAELRAGLARALHDPSLPPQPAGVALSILGRRGWRPPPGLVRSWTPAVAALQAMLDPDLPPDPRVARLLAVLHGRADDLAGAVAPEVEALVGLCLFGRGAARSADHVRRLVEALATVPAELADPALLALLRHLRRLPSRARPAVIDAIRPRRGRLRRELAVLATAAPRIAAREAGRLLDE